VATKAKANFMGPVSHRLASAAIPLPAWERHLTADALLIRKNLVE
jgi:hypothetical protein